MQRQQQRAVLRIGGVPSFLSEESVARMLSSYGATRVLRGQGHNSQFMFSEFTDPAAAERCKAAYNGWTTWGGPGLQIEFDGGSAYHGLDMQQPQSTGQPGSSAAAGAARPAGAGPAPVASTAAAGTTSSTGPTGAGTAPAAGSGLAAALAGLSQSQLSSLAGLLGQAVGPTSGAAAAQQAARPAASQQAAAPAPTQPPAAPAPAPASTTLQDASAQQQAFGNLLPPQGAAVPQLPAGLTAANPLLSQAAAASAALPQQPSLAAALQQLAANAQQQQQQAANAAQLAAPSLLNLLGSQLLPAPAQPAPAAAPGLAGLPGVQQLLAALPGASQLAALPQLQALLQLQQQAQPAAQPPAAPAPVAAVPQPSSTGAQGGPPPPQQQQQQGQDGRGPDTSLPPNAAPTLFFDGLPLDLTKREAAHIFRPIQGYKDLRLVVKEHPHRPGERSTKLFVDFVDVHAATAAMHLLSGYKLDLDDDKSATLEARYGRPMPPRALAQQGSDRGMPGRGPPGPYPDHPPPGGPYGGPPPMAAFGPPGAYPPPGGPMPPDHRRGGPPSEYGRRGDDRTARDRERDRDTRDLRDGPHGRDRERDRERPGDRDMGRDRRGMPDDRGSNMRPRSRWT